MRNNIYKLLVMKFIKITRFLFFNSKVKKLKIVSYMYTKLFHSVINPSELISVEVRGLNISVPGRDVAILAGLLNGTYERTVLQFIEDYLTPGMSFVDVGANCGVHSVVALNSITTGSTFAFEPVYENFELLQSNLDSNNMNSTSIFTERLAISDKSGDSVIYLINGCLHEY